MEFPISMDLNADVGCSKAWFPLVLRIVKIGDFYDIPTSGILTTSGNTSSQKSQTVGDFYDIDVIGRIGIILSQTSQTSAIFTMSENLAVLRIAIVLRIPVSGNRFLRFLGQVGTRLKAGAGSSCATLGLGPFTWPFSSTPGFFFFRDKHSRRWELVLTAHSLPITARNEIYMD